jgi:colicin import membrane protein
MVGSFRTYLINNEQGPVTLAFLLSMLGHIILVVLIVWHPEFTSESPFIPSVIDVQMVDVAEIPEAASSASKSAKTQVSTKQAKAKEKPAPVDEKSPEVRTKDDKKAEVSIAKSPPKTKVAMKYKTFKPKRVLQKALENIEKQVEESPTRPLEDTIKRLREKVEKGEKSDNASTESVPENIKGARTGIFSKGSKQETELIDIYRTEIAYEIQKNWAYAEQLGGGEKNLVASIVIKVMPNGDITDIFFLDRSGNSYLDDSAYKAVVKSSPVRPHPPGLSRPYVELGLRFTPEGVQ